MDFSRIKQLVVPEGEVKELRVGGILVWQKTTGVNYGVEITTSDAEAITDFSLNTSASKTFEVSFNVPLEEQESEVIWTFSGLPSGLSASGATVSGSATSLGDATVTVIVTKGSYSDSKTYIFTVYGIAISNTSLPSGYYNYNYSATLGVTKNLPSGVGNLVYSASGLPSGLGLNSSTGVISGTPTSAGTSTVSVYATQSPYVSTIRNLSINITHIVPRFNNSSTTINISASKCRDKDYVGQCLYILYVTGSGFKNYAVNWGESVYSLDHIIVLRGSASSSTSTPRLKVHTNLDSDNQISVTFYLDTKSTASATTLMNRGITSGTLIIYNNIGSALGSSLLTVLARFTINIGWSS